MSKHNNLIFYDTETTGIQRDFSQILQCGSVVTDSSFNSIAEQDIGCAPLPWAIPTPMAMLTNKKTHLFNSNTSHYEIMLYFKLDHKDDHSIDIIDAENNINNSQEISEGREASRIAPVKLMETKSNVKCSKTVKLINEFMGVHNEVIKF